jgi:hypothetical protein
MYTVHIVYLSLYLLRRPALGRVFVLYGCTGTTGVPCLYNHKTIARPGPRPEPPPHCNVAALLPVPVTIYDLFYSFRLTLFMSNDTFIHH